jgi:phosphoglycolate phosphatase
MKKTIIFDLDGTLVDIEPIFFRLYNTLAQEFGYAPLSPEEVPYLKQFHLKDLVWKRLGWRTIFLPYLLKRGREEYNRLVPEVTLFPGIKKLLTTLHDQGHRIGIVSSSREDTIRSIVERYMLPIDFIYSGKLFNKAQSLREALEKEHLKLSETTYVGDEVRDVEACQKTGLAIISVTWGLNSKEALKQAGGDTVDTREELLARLSK